MQSRKSIPNVGRRAQGRKALFMLKGSGVITGTSCPSGPDDPEDAAFRTRDPLTQGSLAMGEEEGEVPVTYDQSVLSQPSHPYNRIIQRILHRHRAAHRMESPDYGGKHPFRAYGQGIAAGSAPPYTKSDHHTLSSERHLSRPRLTRADDAEDSSLATHRRLAEDENPPHLQWADILRADHCAVSEDPHDLPCDLVSPEDQSLSSLDLAKGYLTDRGFISDRSQDVNSLPEGSLDTSRSEPRRISSFPRLARKRDLQPLDDVLDYFWVYQGMSRQLLDRHSPSYLWKREWLQKKPSPKLPPLYLAAEHRSEAASSEGSVPFSRLSSEEADTSEGTPQERNSVSERSCGQKCQHPRTSPSSDPHCQDRGALAQNPQGGETCESHDGNSSARDSLSSEEPCDKRQGRKVTLVVKMPVLTRESSSSDVLDQD